MFKYNINNFNYSFDGREQCDVDYREVLKFYFTMHMVNHLNKKELDYSYTINDMYIFAFGDSTQELKKMVLTRTPFCLYGEAPDLIDSYMVEALSQEIQDNEELAEYYMSLFKDKYSDSFEFVKNCFYLETDKMSADERHKSMIKSIESVIEPSDPEKTGFCLFVLTFYNRNVLPDEKPDMSIFEDIRRDNSVYGRYREELVNDIIGKADCWTDNIMNDPVTLEYLEKKKKRLLYFLHTDEKKLTDKLSRLEYEFDPELFLPYMNVMTMLERGGFNRLSLIEDLKIDVPGIIDEYYKNELIARLSEIEGDITKLDIAGDIEESIEKSMTDYSHIYIMCCLYDIFLCAKMLQADKYALMYLNTYRERVNIVKSSDTENNADTSC